jgi:hypothetical protein
MISRHINLKTNQLRQAKRIVKIQRSTNRQLPLVSTLASIPQSFDALTPRLVDAPLPEDTPKWAISRTLAFLNSATCVADITNGIKNFSASEKGYTIGEKVAQRILDKRESLPYKRFSSIEELENIQGFGQDKRQDLILSVSMPADQYFQQQMRSQLLGENWNLNYHTITFKNPTDFLQVAENEATLTHYVSQEVGQIAIAQKGESDLFGRLAAFIVPSCYVERFNSAEQARFAFALWFYKIDEDNWFSFNRVLELIQLYLTYHENDNQYMDFLFYKGFPNGIALVNGLTSKDLPVVINYAEQKVTIWTVELFD